MDGRRMERMKGTAPFPPSRFIHYEKVKRFRFEKVVMSELSTFWFRSMEIFCRRQSLVSDEDGEERGVMMKQMEQRFGWMKKW